jgi:RNA polymerase sigma factor (sigma-70 family)
MQDMIALIEPVIPALRRYARALLHNPSAADDLVQDCLERAISAWGQRRADGDVKSWLFAILHNLAMNSFAQARRKGAHIPLEDADPSAFARDANQENGLRHRELVNALAQLPDDQRSVILLVSVEGLSYAQTAKVLAVPVGTVMSRLSRGRERLAAMLRAEPAGRSGSHLRRVK